MTKTWTSATLADISNHGQNLNIGNFWPEAATMAEIGPTMGLKPLSAFFIIIIIKREFGGGICW